MRHRQTPDRAVHVCFSVPYGCPHAVAPVVSAPPPAIGFLDGGLSYEALIDRLQNYVQYTALYNVTGAPAISLPLSMSPDGLPIGAMFGARNGDEKTLLELAYELEEIKPWAGRKPMVFG